MESVLSIMGVWLKPIPTDSAGSILNKANLEWEVYNVLHITICTFPALWFITVV